MHTKNVQWQGILVAKAFIYIVRIGIFSQKGSVQSLRAPGYLVPVNVHPWSLERGNWKEKDQAVQSSGKKWE